MKRVDAIVAIGGGINCSGELSKTSASRVETAVDLFKQGLSDKLLFSGRWSHRLTQKPPFSEAEAMRRYATTRQISATAILLENKSQDTLSNAYFIKKDFVEYHKWNRIAVVTCPAHAARTQLVFSRIFGQSCDVVTYPTLEISSHEYRQREAVSLLAISDKLDQITPGNLQSVAQAFEYLAVIDQAA
jgi:uncharacterized SAM-binding protein YcdF (DUF218 family)